MMSSVPPKLRIMVGIGLGLYGAGIQAVCLNPLGCAPKNYAECMEDATKRPAELGVRMAAVECFNKWKKPENDRRAEELTKLANMRPLLWPKVTSTASKAAELIKDLGQPSLILGMHKCTPRNNFSYDTDFYGLRQQGRTDKSILDQLQRDKKIDFDLARARQEKYSDTSIVDAMMRKDLISVFNTSKESDDIMCFTYLWLDGRPSRRDAYYRAEFLTSGTLTLWGYWRYSVENFSI